MGGTSYATNSPPTAPPALGAGTQPVGCTICACLGTALNLPMTKVTLVEDLTMAAMAAGMLLLMM